MLNVKSLEETEEIMTDKFGDLCMEKEYVQLSDAIDRVLAEDVISTENIPSFDRSTVDGYAVISSDVFGCSETIPAILENIGKVSMGQVPDFFLSNGKCAYVPTGGQIPRNADAMVMIEHSEPYYDNIIGISKSVSPGQNIIFKGDDVRKGEIVLSCGTVIRSKEIGLLAAMGITSVAVKKRPVVGVISTGDELIRYDDEITDGKIRDVNSEMLCSLIGTAKSKSINYGIIKDKYFEIKSAVLNAVKECDIVLISGGTSVGEKDDTYKVISELGKVYVYGIAIKPGKPTIVGEIQGKPVLGLPGNPVAAYFIFNLLVLKLLYHIQGRKISFRYVDAVLLNTVPSNNGREECIAVRLSDIEEHSVQTERNVRLSAKPIIGKSGLIAKLKDTDGFIRISRECEGYSKGMIVKVCMFL